MRMMPKAAPRGPNRAAPPDQYVGDAVMKALRIFLLAVPLALGLNLASSHAAEVDCTADQLKTANAAVSEATQALKFAIEHLTKPNAHDADLLVLWFGVASDKVATKIKSNLTLSMAYLNSITFKCSNSTDINLGDVYAYVTPGNAFRIVLSAWFFNTNDVGFYSKMGIIIHEMTHFYLTGGTGDAEGGGDWIMICKKLAIDDPNKAQNTAYNHQFFVESVYFGL